jgi:hypothetical protein
MTPGNSSLAATLYEGRNHKLDKISNPSNMSTEQIMTYNTLEDL